jgi:predicted RNA-binding Zn-ribbon protein involved in translation (DUF1610 family)
METETELLRRYFVEQGVDLASVKAEVESRPTSPPRPVLHCSNCQAELREHEVSECPHCGWLKYPPEKRQNWGQVGRCPRCGFAYRWDGARCSHCGHAVGPKLPL